VTKKSQKVARKPGEVFRDTFLPKRKQWRFQSDKGLHFVAYKTKREAVQWRDAWAQADNKAEAGRNAARVAIMGEKAARERIAASRRETVGGKIVAPRFKSHPRGFVFFDPELSHPWGVSKGDGGWVGFENEAGARRKSYEMGLLDADRGDDKSPEAKAASTQEALVEALKRYVLADEAGERPSRSVLDQGRAALRLVEPPAPARTLAEAAKIVEEGAWMGTGSHGEPMVCLSPLDYKILREALRLTRTKNGDLG
jgi:hypothetical protein